MQNMKCNVHAHYITHASAGLDALHTIYEMTYPTRYKNAMHTMYPYPHDIQCTSCGHIT